MSVDTAVLTHSWEGFDIVCLGPYHVDYTNKYVVHYMSELYRSCAGYYENQERWVMDDDSVMLPFRVTDYHNEYTHYMRLPEQTTDVWPGDVKTSNKVVKADWWLHYRVSDLIQYDYIKVTSGTANYFGYAKPDRVTALSDYGVNLDKAKNYSDYLLKARQSLALVMLNSQSHAGGATPRFVESMYLSVVVWPSHIKVRDYEPPENRRFSSRLELEDILKSILWTTPAQRLAEIQRQRQAVDQMSMTKVTYAN